MTLRTFVGFVADFTTEHDGESPPGKVLADYIAEKLAHAGFAVDGPCDREGWAWDLCTREDQLEIMTTVGLVDDMEANPPRQWLITNDCSFGLFKRLLGGKMLIETRDRSLRKFCETLHGIMGDDVRFSDIVWYNKDTFDKPGDQPADAP